MILLQRSKNALKTLVIVVGTCLFFFSPVAIASTENMPVPIMKEIHITKPDFEYSNHKPSDASVRISSAIVSLPEGESGTIDSIKIIGPNDELEFGCTNQNVVNGTDLIKSCGGNAYLKKGDTTYIASGSNFKHDTTLEITLIP